MVERSAMIAQVGSQPSRVLRCFKQTHCVNCLIAHEYCVFGAAFLIDPEFGPNSGQVLERVDLFVTVTTQIHIFTAQNEVWQIAFGGIDLVWFAEASCASASGQINRLEDRKDVVRASPSKHDRLEFATSRVDALIRVF